MCFMKNVNDVLADGGFGDEELIRARNRSAQPDLRHWNWMSGLISRIRGFLLLHTPE